MAEFLDSDPRVLHIAYPGNSLFGPTLDEIRASPRSRFLILETAAPPGTHKPTEIDDLVATLAARKDVIGFNWYTYYQAGVKDETDWKVDSGSQSLAAFHSAVTNALAGFNMEHR
ncbi:hypothetical protein [Sphaerisporangium sp. NPDC051011]|uniref:hypothetical protein n=1 Tax=Sphaerisporangium sp. NPDC051011 TaxID=3155792 RepID=UPI0033C576C1